MINAGITFQERDFLWALEKIEASRIAHGEYDEFVKLETVCDQIGLGSSQGLDIARRLARRRFLLLDRSTGETLLRSKVTDIIKSVYRTATLVQRRFVRDVSDLKYLRFTKQIPQQTIPLDDKETKDTLIETLKVEPGAELNIIEVGIQAVASRYAKLSNFQISAAKSILRLLGEKASRSLVIVAETGAGKSLGYHLPLMLWILRKKARAYLQRAPGKRSNESVNCSALLLFPRNVLARDQYEELLSLNGRINDAIKKMKLPTDLASLLSINIERDFGGVGLGERTRIYQSQPDVIVTNPDTLKRRLMNPLCTSLYRKGIDLVLYDEIHLYYGLHGANVASLNARLQNLLPTSPVFVGMSATIASPQKHCQRLFSTKELPETVTDREDNLVDYVSEHNVIVKPRAGRSALGVCTDVTSCLLHNRREDTLQAHALGNELRPKTLCFVDSLDLAGRWVAYQRNYENYQRFGAVRTSFRREYPIHYAPLAIGDPTRLSICTDCKSGNDVIASVCTEYREGRCWWFSQDNATFVRWLTLPTGVTPNDNIRVKRLTSQEVDSSELEDIYGLFIDRHLDENELPIDALIATSVLEVGVDFRGIKEVIMYGEIRSPSSYKQKAGRGAREGNLSEGLFVMTVIPPSPLANFYYRHFHRLVYPSLSPLPLEPRNPDVIRSHAFCAVFDFLAFKGIDIFNVVNANQNPAQVEGNFSQAIQVIHSENESARSFVTGYLLRLGLHASQSKEIAQKAIDNCLRVLESLSSDYVIKGDKKKLVIWAFEAFREMNVMAILEDDFKTNLEKRAEDLRRITDTKDSIIAAKEAIIGVLSRLGIDYSSESGKIGQLLSKIEATL